MRGTSDGMPCFTVKGTLPSLNQYLAACNRNPHIGAKMKRDSMEAVSWAIRRDLRGWKAKRPLIVHFVYYEPSKKRDKDNIDSFFRKTCFDSLQQCGVIENDGWGEIENYTHDFYVDKENPRVEVCLEEIGG